MPKVRAYPLVMSRLCAPIHHACQHASSIGLVAANCIKVDMRKHDSSRLFCKGRLDGRRRLLLSQQNGAGFSACTFHHGHHEGLVLPFMT